MKRSKKNGFTLVEVLVAALLLGVVIVVAADVYVTSLSSQRRAFAKQNALDSTRFALEVMGRAIRQSTITSVSDTSLTIEHPEKGTVTYDLSGSALQENSSSLTGSNVVVEELSFISLGTGAGDGHPRITTVLVIRSDTTRPNEESRVRLQTTITPRPLEQ